MAEETLACRGKRRGEELIRYIPIGEMSFEELDDDTIMSSTNCFSSSTASARFSFNHLTSFQSNSSSGFAKTHQLNISTATVVAELVGAEVVPPPFFCTPASA